MPRSESITQYTEYCPPATNLTVKAGWTHNTALLWIRNLIRIVTGNPGNTGWLNGISRPCLYQGDYLDKYIERRPIIHPEGE